MLLAVELAQNGSGTSTTRKLNPPSCISSIERSRWLYPGGRLHLVSPKASAKSKGRGKWQLQLAKSDCSADSKTTEIGITLSSSLQ